MPCCSSRWLHRYAMFTACVALLPIVVGAVVTTVGAGMAFRDWPTSDGQGMFSYPWLRSAGDKFLEHGHRLAGIAIGLAAIGLVVLTFLSERRGWVRGLSVLALLGIIGQGVLGGYRVLMDQQGLAFVHGSLAAIVFAFLCSFVTVTSESWVTGGASPAAFKNAADQCDAIDSRHVWLSTGVSILVFVQYVLGGLLRHRGMALNEHLFFAGVATLGISALAVACLRSRAVWLTRLAGLLGVLVALQLVLGLAAWIAKWGLGAGSWVAWLGFDGFVPVAGSPVQIAFRTGHVLVGMFLFATTVVLTVRVSRMSAGRSPVLAQPAMSPPQATAGGVA